MDTPNNSSTEPTEAFVAGELAQAQKALRKTKIYGTIIFAALALETIVVTARFAYALQPHEAATIASGFVQDQLDSHADELRDSLKERIPAMIQQTPDYVIQQIPMYRQAVEARVNQSLSDSIRQNAQSCGEQMDDYLATNKEAISAVVESASSPEAAVSLAPGLRAEIREYLDQKPASGESVTQQVATSLAMLKDIQAKMDHLANGKNLSPADKQTRHAIAVLAASVRRQNLQPLPIKDGLPGATQLTDADH